MRALALVVAALSFVACDCGCVRVKSTLVRAMTPDYYPEGDPGRVRPVFDGADAARPRIDVALVPVAEGFTNITDLQFAPGDPSVIYVLEKEGGARWVSLADGARGTWLTVDVISASEEGLLGLAFHPRFAENGRLFLNYTVRARGEDVSRVAEWRVPPGKTPREATPVLHGVLLEVVQPYPNHDAGQLAFGPDGYLYVGWGDGGFRDDPHGHGQNGKTMLGAMLRIDVDRAGEGRPYAIPEDNPFIEDPAFLPEVWAYGLRNPWRYSFDPQGRLVVADVGQDAWEEVHLVRAGDNLGWNLREGTHCFPEDRTPCETEGLVEPVYEYGHDEGRSITGGYVYTGSRVPALSGKYVFGDFVTGRLWAIELPESTDSLVPASSLGKWPLLPSTFGRDPQGELYLGDFYQGVIYRFDPAPTAP